MENKKGRHRIKPIRELLTYRLSNRYPELYEIPDFMINEGWHHCQEFGDRLIGPGMREHGMCSCYGIGPGKHDLLWAREVISGETPE